MHVHLHVFITSESVIKYNVYLAKSKSTVESKLCSTDRDSMLIITYTVI